MVTLPMAVALDMAVGHRARRVEAEHPTQPVQQDGPNSARHPHNARVPAAGHVVMVFAAAPQAYLVMNVTDFDDQLCYIVLDFTKVFEIVITFVTFGSETPGPEVQQGATKMNTARGVGTASAALGTRFMNTRWPGARDDQ